MHFPQMRQLKSSELLKVYQLLRKTFGYQDWWPGDSPFEVIVGAILTQNTAWANVEKAIKNLKKARKLSLRALQRISRKKLSVLIRPAGYFNMKADRLKYFLDFLVREYEGNLRQMQHEKRATLRRKLLEVNGIGPETADSILLYALGKKSFVIDAYTRRIFSRHGLAEESDGYDSWQNIFIKALPQRRALYNDYHAQIVKLAKDYCRKTPDCKNCPLKGFFE